MASGGNWPGGYGDNVAGRYIIHLNDQRIRPVQPRGETFPIQEGNDCYGQASLDFFSIPATNGAPTLHQANSQVSSRDSPNIATGLQAAMGLATRPFGSEPVDQDVLPLYSNGGYALPHMMENLSIQGPPTDACSETTAQTEFLQLPERERKKSDSDVSMNSDEERLSPVKVFDMSLQRAREDSFKTAPEIFYIIAQLSPQLLAEQGFYYTGNNDEVQCYSCGTGLCQWEHDDDPLVEHIKHGPPEICQHLQTIREKEILITIQETLKDAKIGWNEPLINKTSDFQADVTTSKESSYRSLMFSENSGQFAGAFQGDPETFRCFACKENKVNHTQLECGHGICDKCITNSDVPMQNRVCSACKQPVIDYVPYSPGCL